MFFSFGHLLSLARAGLAAALLLAVVLLLPTAPAWPAPNPGRDAYADGLVSYRAQRWAEAAQAFQEFAAAFPDHPLAPEALYLAAEGLLALSRYGEAAQEFRAVADRFPKHELAPAALANLALCQARLGQDEAARQTLAALASRYPNSRDAAKAKEPLPQPVPAPEPGPPKKAPGADQAEPSLPAEVFRPSKTAAGAAASVFAAVEKGNLEALQAALDARPEAMADRDAEGNTPLHKAAALNRTDLARELIRRKADVNADNPSYIYVHTPLHEAVRNNHAEMAALLLAHKADINAGRYVRGPETSRRYTLTPLFLAVLSDHADMVGFLLGHGADPNLAAHPALGGTPLGLAEKKGLSNLVRMLSEKRARP
jgi:tol-pal system protein YbgF